MYVLSLDQLREDLGATSAKMSNRVVSIPCSSHTDSGSTPLNLDLLIFSQPTTSGLPVSFSTGFFPAQKKKPASGLSKSTSWGSFLNLFTGKIDFLWFKIFARTLDSVAATHNHSLDKETLERFRFRYPAKEVEEMSHEPCIVQMQNRCK